MLLCPGDVGVGGVTHWARALPKKQHSTVTVFGAGSLLRALPHILSVLWDGGIMEGLLTLKSSVTLRVSSLEAVFWHA